MQNDENDAVLVQRVQNGEKRAFNLLVSKYQYRIKHLVSRFIKDPMEQEDIVQETFIKAYRAIGHFRGESAFYTWLYRIAVNTAKNFIVASARRPPAQDIAADNAVQADYSDRLTEMNSPEEILQGDELVKIIKDTIAGLPEELRVAIQLREFEGLTYEDIAAALGCPIGTVRSRIFRAREAISQAISQLDSPA